MAFEAFSGGSSQIDVEMMLRRLEGGAKPSSIQSRPRTSTGVSGRMPQPHQHRPEWSVREHATVGPQEYQELWREAIWADGFPDPQASEAPAVRGELITRPVRKHLKVPIVEEVKVPVEKWTTKTVYEPREVEQTVMKPVTRTKQVEETRIEVQEQQEKRTRMVWKLVPEEYYETVKKPVTVPVSKEVPYTDYEPHVQRKTIQVPVEKKVKEEGFRIDRKLGSRMVEVVRDEVYEVKPHFERFGDVRVRYTDHKPEWHGMLQVGEEVFRPSTASTIDRGMGGADAARGGKGNAYIHGHASSKEAQRALFKKLDKDGSGAIDFDEFHKMMSNGQRPGALGARSRRP